MPQESCPKFPPSSSHSELQYTVLLCLNLISLSHLGSYRLKILGYNVGTSYLPIDQLNEKYPYYPLDKVRSLSSSFGKVSSTSELKPPKPRTSTDVNLSKQRSQKHFARLNLYPNSDSLSKLRRNAVCVPENFYHILAGDTREVDRQSRLNFDFFSISNISQTNLKNNVKDAGRLRIFCSVEFSTPDHTSSTHA